MSDRFMRLYYNKYPTGKDPMEARISYPYVIALHGREEIEEIKELLDNAGFESANFYCGLGLMYVNFTLRRYGFAEKAVHSGSLNREWLSKEEFVEKLWNPYFSKSNKEKYLRNNYLQSGLLSAAELISTLIANAGSKEDQKNRSDRDDSFYAYIFERIRNGLWQIEHSELSGCDVLAYGSLERLINETLGKILKGENKNPPVFELIDTYYEWIYAHYFDNQGLDSDITVAYPADLQIPLMERGGEIGKAMTALLNLGYDVNGSDGDDTPLTYAVNMADAPMVDFLLTRGADPALYPLFQDDDEEDEPFGFGNPILDHIDIHYMNTCWDASTDKKYLEGLFRVAVAFAKSSNVEPYYGLCLKIDEDRSVELGPLKMKY